MSYLRSRMGGLYLVTLLVAFVSTGAIAKTDKPNILVIWGDDVGMWNISAYHNGMMGGTTPNIDRIADGLLMESHEQDRVIGIANQIEAVRATMEKRPGNYSDGRD